MNSYIASNINTISFILAVIAFYFTYFQWHKNRNEKRVHLLKILRVQLDCLGAWVSSESIGYGNELTEHEKFDNANPFKFIYETASDPLISTTLLEEVSNVPHNLIGEIGQLYYDLIRIKNLQDIRSKLVFSELTVANNLSSAISTYLSTNNVYSYSQFTNSLKPDEKLLSDRLVSYGEIIHCSVIGNKLHGARQHWDIISDWVNKESIAKISWEFLCITFLAVFILLLVGFSSLNLLLNLSAVTIIILSATNISLLVGILTKSLPIKD